MKYILVLLLLFIGTGSIAQHNNAIQRRLAQKKDTLRLLTCPLQDGYEAPAPDKSAFGYTKQENSITLISKTDTVVRACIDATVSKIQQDEEGKWEVVLFHNDYWLWYSGIDKVTVKRNQTIKSGDTMGIIKPAGEIDLLLYDFETPVDPKKYLDCKKTTSR